MTLKASPRISHEPQVGPEAAAVLGACPDAVLSAQPPHHAMLVVPSDQIRKEDRPHT